MEALADELWRYFCLQTLKYLQTLGLGQSGGFAVLTAGEEILQRLKKKKSLATPPGPRHHSLQAAGRLGQATCEAVLESCPLAPTPTPPPVCFLIYKMRILGVPVVAHTNEPDWYP